MIVQVPASSANLGPGFDCLGIAWQLYNTIEFLPAPELRIRGCDARFAGQDNLAWQGFAAVWREAGREAPGVEICFRETAIPVSRGLGSSAALIAAGAAAANALGGFGFSKERLLTVCTRVEGHPDNLAPSLFGGLTACAMDGQTAVCARLTPVPTLRFLAAVPDFEFSTAAARGALPKAYSRSEAVFNLSRTALVTEGLRQGDFALLKTGMEDRLHQPFRLPLIPGAEDFCRLVREQGEGRAVCCLSGAGSTLLVTAADDDMIERLLRELPPRFPQWNFVPLLPDTEGVRVEET